jgi:antitoxin component YwqK of YwqJK toxin-antitoxin module
LKSWSLSKLQKTREKVCIRQFHPHRRSFREWTVANGNIEGILREWNENGTLVIETPMKRGVVHGVVKRWNLQGKFLGECKMKMGKGVIREWNEDGSLKTETEFVNKNALRVKIYGDPKKKVHEAFSWNHTPVSKKKFYELLKGDA